MAVESIVSYLHDCFGENIVAIVPRLRTSAGTIITCAWMEIYIRRQSLIGPTESQLGRLPVGEVIEEFDRAIGKRLKT